MIQILTTLAIALYSPPLTALSLNGTSTEGTLVSLSAEVLTLQTAKGLRKLPLAELAKISFTAPEAAAPAPTTWVELVDGTHLAATAYMATGSEAEVRLADGSELRLPLDSVRGVRFRKLAAAQQAEWDHFLLTPARADRLAIRKPQGIDYLEGVLGNVDHQVVDFELDGEVIPVKRAKIEGVLYAGRSGQERPPAVLELLTHAGSRIPAAEWTATATDLEVRIPAGLRLKWSYDQLQEVDFSTAKIIYLSDLQPVSVQWTPYLPAGGLGDLLERFYRPKTDQPLVRHRNEGESGHLEIANGDGAAAGIESYDRGISLHSRTQVVYEVPRGARRLIARAGIDPSTRFVGHVRLVLLADGRELFAEDISGRGGPRDVSINLQGVRRLELLVDYGENQDVGDHLNFCNARILK